MNIGFIGCGNMGSAIIKGIKDKGLFEEIRVFDKNPEKLNIDGIKKSELSDTAECDIVVLAVKPNVIYDVIGEIKDYTGKNSIIVSIAAGQSIERMEKAFGKEIKIIRVMPNTPLMVGAGMTALSPNKLVSEDELLKVKEIFSSSGKAEIVSESLMDAVTGISGSSPAYAYMFIEALAKAGIEHGMSEDKSYTFAAQSVLGAAEMVLKTGIHPRTLKENVCSPGGTTIEAVKVLEERDLDGIIMEAVSRCVEKSKSM